MTPYSWPPTISNSLNVYAKLVVEGAFEKAEGIIGDSKIENKRSACSKIISIVQISISTTSALS